MFKLLILIIISGFTLAYWEQVSPLLHQTLEHLDKTISSIHSDVGQAKQNIGNIKDKILGE